MRVDTGVHLRSPAVCVLVRVQGVRVQNTSQLDIQLHGTILVEDPVHAVLVVRGREDMRDDQLPSTGNNHRLVTEIGVLEEDTRVFFVDADSILDSRARTGFIDKCRIHIVNRALAVAAQGETVGHVSTAILTQIKRVFPLVRVFRVSIWNNHLRERQTVEHRSNGSLVVESDVVQHNAFTVVEANMDIPVLPIDNPVVDFERNALWLCDVDGFQVLPVTTLLFDGLRMVAVRGCLAERSSDRRDINMDNLLCLGIIDRTEVKRVRILRLINTRPVVHQRLLQPDPSPEAFIVTNRPRCTQLAPSNPLPER